jgi:hypothetical protein
MSSLTKATVNLIVEINGKRYAMSSGINVSGELSTKDLANLVSICEKTIVAEANIKDMSNIKYNGDIVAQDANIGDV